MSNYSLFSAIGIEIEYMLVDATTLDIQPKSDVILKALAEGHLVNEIALGPIAISNELVMHVLELKNNGPALINAPLAEQFHQTIERLQPLLQSLHLTLLPTGAHPWMNPTQETKRWPYDNAEIYQQFNALFNCEGHGWSNLQSMHINLPFASDEEFNALHNAIRLLLPLLPALAASSPFFDGHYVGVQDGRLDYYGNNQRRFPSISGDIIPEFICSEKQYQQMILAPMYQAIQPFDPDGILQHEWLNSRAAIPKFHAQAIEIRIIDTQECVNADIAIARAIFAILQHWIKESDYFLRHPAPTSCLKAVYDRSRKEGLQTRLDDKTLAKQWQLSRSPKTCREAWYALLEKVSSHLDTDSQFVLDYILKEGNLSERLLRACNHDYSKTTLKKVYQQLGYCLLNNQLFNPL